MATVMDAKQSNYFSWVGERLYQKSWTEFLYTVISVLNNSKHCDAIHFPNSNVYN